jgi:hypothetical protein
MDEFQARTGERGAEAQFDVSHVPGVLFEVQLYIWWTIINVDNSNYSDLLSV